MDCQVFFDIGNPARGLIVQGAIGFAEAQETYWPLEQINQMLALFYRSSMDVPQVCVAIESGVVVGYLAMPRNSYSQEQLNRIFWQGLIDSDSAVENDIGYKFTQPAPFAVSAVVDDLTIGLAAYQQPAGPVLPLAPVNYALRLLLGQLNWPDDLAPFLYPVSKYASPNLAGLWIGPSVDDLNNRSDADDVLFRTVRAFNYPNEAPLRQRLAANRALNSALSRYPDFAKKVFS